MRKCLVLCLVMALPAFAATKPARGDSITVQSDATTLGAVASANTNFDTANVAGLTFTPVLVGAYGTYTPVPPDAPPGTEVVNIGPNSDMGYGQSGYFEMTFTLPTTFANIQMTGEANVDDSGRLFLNGNAITPSIFSGDSGVITEFGNVSFGTSNASYFQAGLNTILISDDDLIDGGPSGGAFYATITFGGASVPEPSSLLLYGQVVAAAFGVWWMKRSAGRAVSRARG